MLLRAAQAEMSSFCLVEGRGQRVGRSKGGKGGTYAKAAGVCAEAVVAVFTRICFCTH